MELVINQTNPVGIPPTVKPGGPKQQVGLITYDQLKTMVEITGSLQF